MTYIAALRSPEGIVISADTQETYSEEVVYLEKINVDRAASYQIAIGGAGRGELIDGFILHVIQTIKKDAPEDGEKLERSIAGALLEFYQNDVRLLPGKTKGVKFIIAATRSDGTDVYLWQTKGARLFKVARRAVIGYRAPFCDYILKRLYSANLPLSQLVLLSVYLVAIAKQSGISVGGETQLVVVRNIGIATEAIEYVKNMEDRLLDYERRVNQIFLACADTSISVVELGTLLREFSAAAIELHRSHIDGIVSKLTFETMMNINDAYRTLPSPHVITFGLRGFSIEHDADKLDKKIEWFRKLAGSLPDHPFYFQCAHCGMELEYRIKEHENIIWNCPSCNAPAKTLGKVTRFRKIGQPAWTDIAPSDDQEFV